MGEEGLLTREEAVRVLEEGRAEIGALLARVPKADLERPGIGGGEWSPRDLVGHLESWEEHALDALAAWERGERAPIDRLISSRGINRINADDVARKASLSCSEARRRADATHARIIEAIRTMPDERWRTPATARARKPLGVRLGELQGGPRGLFMHADAHVEDLVEFVRERMSGRHSR
ncbi:MAG: DinB family protein [Actinomycetota bacterium]